MKRTCDGCRALYMTMYKSTCELGYCIDQRYIKPLENCPKPKTYMQMIELQSIREVNKLSKEELANWKLK